MDFKLDDYQQFKNQLKKQKKDFKTSQTNFTKIITIGKKKIKFTDSVVETLTLKLINLVKNDAKNYIKKSVKDSESNESYNAFKKNKKEIDFYKFYSKNKNQDIKGYKVDIVGAYWNLAINEGVLSEKTISFWNENKKKFKNSKNARLRALGSLATTKTIDIYKNGKLTSTSVVFNELTKELYMYICHRLAEIMDLCAKKFKENVIYYYWDCLFFNDKINKKEVSDYLFKLGYLVTFEDANFLVVSGVYSAKIYDYISKKSYPVKINK